ncbi:RCC1 domain-containing protein [Streptomyces acidiscabies]|uniref:RCC1 domain-containing protein n=1 Tax=Streptomyces acidiscabies TaxID=42234 RepID=UPI000952E330|nr:chromosome condensation regulator RCC1 [Streptomyces acidiscabies]
MRPLLLAALAATTLTLATPVPLAHAAGPADPWARAWGDNAQGQLGNGSVLAQQTPAAVTGVARDDVREVSAGGGANKDAFTVALLNDGTVKSWGANDKGQLGNGTITAQSFPGTVAGLYGVSDLSAGADHVLAVKSGRVLAWGSNAKKQLGTGQDTTNPYKTPMTVQSLDKVKDVGAGCEFSVALRQDGTVWTWGAGANGRLGTGGTANRETPQQVPDLTDVAAVSVGCDHVLALTADGVVKAWGKGTEGQLGDDLKTDSPKPVDVAYLDSVAKIFATHSSSFAVLDDGSVQAWGKNDTKQLADGTTANRTSAVPIDILTGVQEIAGGPDFTLAALDDGSVIGWGANTAAQLGDGTVVSPPGTTRTLPPGSGVTHVTATKAGKSGFAY